MNWDKLGSQIYQQRSRIASSKIKRFTGETGRWRRMCLERDGFACVLCHSKKKLEVHHIVRWYDAPLLRLKKNNGVTLCHDCHARHHQATGAEFPKEITAQLLAYVSGKASRQTHSKQSIILIKKHLGITPPEF
jgi:5-methylcytosine-specific restriction endonuclease McrA